MPVAPSDSVSLRSEGTFEEHIQELVDYLARGRSDEERIAYIKPFVEALMPKEGRKPFDEDEARRRGVLEMVLSRVQNMGDGTERETEGFFNLLMSHITSNYQPDSALPHIKGLIKAILSSQRQSGVKYRVFTNLFNATPRNSKSRVLIYTALLKAASDNEELDVIPLAKIDADKWLEEWDISPEEKGEFCQTVYDACIKAGQPTNAYPYLVKRAQLLSTTAQADSALLDAVVDGLKQPAIFNVEPLLKLPNISKLKDAALLSLLKIFLSSNLLEYQTWTKTNQADLDKRGIDSTVLEKKIRLLTLASLASKRVGKEISYAEIAGELQISESEVETWVIQGIRDGLILGKLNQPTKTFVVIRSTTRNFDKQQWETLDKRLTAWKGAIQDVLQVVAGARKRVPLGDRSSQPVALVS